MILTISNQDFHGKDQARILDFFDDLYALISRHARWMGQCTIQFRDIAVKGFDFNKSDFIDGTGSYEFAKMCWEEVQKNTIVSFRFLPNGAIEQLDGEGNVIKMPRK